MNTTAERARMSTRIFAVSLCLLACGYYYYFFLARVHVKLDIEVSENTVFKMYWVGDEPHFSEKKRVAVPLSPETDHYEFFLTDIGGVAKLRIDPHQYEGEARLKKLTLTQRGYQPIVVDLAELQPLHDVKNLLLDDSGLKVVSGGIDPRFLYSAVPERAPFGWGTELVRLALICVVVLMVLRFCAPLQHDYAYVPLMLAAAFILVLTMAAVSKRNAHPDEYVHLDATAYYQEHWLPPQIDDPAIAHTYSVYGMSRLNNGELYYLLAGKVAKLAESVKLKELLSLRLFNVVLFALITLYAFASVPARLVALPLLVSPQVWYLFSYCGSDAFALFVCFLAGCELVRPSSCLNRLIEERRPRGGRLAGLLVALLLALLFLLKKNYYPFLALFYLAALWRIVRAQDREARSLFFKRLVAVSLLGVAFAGLRFGADYYVNGPDRQRKIETMQEETAHPWYKPSTELHQKHVSLYLRERGTTLKDMLVQNKWLEKSFVTGFGVYGYFTIGAPERFYDLVKWAGCALLVYVYLIIFVRGGPEASVLGLAAAGLGAALLGVSLYHSWTMDFQAQGRYLFPILSMFGIVLGRARAVFSTRLFTLGVSQLYLLALYSFIFVALAAIPRPL